MPKHYAYENNILHRRVQFNNTKVVNLSYGKTFDIIPQIQLTMNDSGNVPVYKTNITTSNVKIRFKSKWTGTVDVLIMER